MYILIKIFEKMRFSIIPDLVASSEDGHGKKFINAFDVIIFVFFEK